MNALDCTDIKALLSALIDDQLDEHTRHEVERHLADCEACCGHINEHERLEALLAMGGELALHARQELPRGFEDEVLARTVRAAAPAPSVFRSAVTWTGWFAAAASIALAAFIWVTDQRPAPVPRVASVESVEIVEPPQEAVASSAQTPGYATGLNLQSSVYDGAFGSAEELRTLSRTILGDPVRSPAIGDVEGFGGIEVAFGAPRHRDLSTTDPSASFAHRPGARQAPAISRDEADVIYNISVLMHLLADADLTTFADVESVRRVVLADDLIARLSETRERVDAADRPALLAAEAVLVRVVEGPLDRDDVRHLSETVARLDLPAEIGGITDRWDRAHSM